MPIWVAAADNGKTDSEDEPSTGERITKIMNGYQSGMRVAFTKLRAAKSPEERKEIEMPDGKSAVKAVVNLLESDPKDPVAERAVVWAARLGMQFPDIFPKIESLIKDHYTDLEGLENVCFSLSYYGGDTAIGLLDHIIEKSENASAVAASLFSMAKIKAEAKEQDEAEKLLERIVKDYPEAKIANRSIAEMAQGQLFEVRHLAIGKVAPEIEGEKADGSAFKLSDYRGKVVVIDFFGHW